MTTGVKEVEVDEATAAFKSALDEAELSVRNWLGGRVPPTPKNRANFHVMLEHTRAVCGLFPSLKGIIEPTLMDRMSNVFEWLKVINQVGLAQEKIDEVVALLKKLAEREKPS